MGSLPVNSIPQPSRAAADTVIVVMDGNTGKGSLDALEWAIKYIVGSNDTLVVLGVLPEIGKKPNPSCLPFNLSIGNSGIYFKLEFSTSGGSTPSELQKEISRRKKRSISKSSGAVTTLNLQDFHMQIFERKINNIYTRMLDCHVALLKTKGVATLIPSKITGPESEEWQTVCKKIDDIAFTSNTLVEEPHLPEQPPSTQAHTRCHGGQGSREHDQAVLLLKIVSRIRHINILNLIGHCCIGDSIFFVCDCPKDSLETCLLSDKAATNLLWNSRWGIALDIGEAIRYLHEDFVDGSIVNLSLCSSNIGLARASSDMLSIYEPTIKQVKLNDDPLNELQSTKADINDYGVLLLELISGQSRRLFEKDGKSLVDWAMPFLENNLLSPLMDPRLTERSDPQAANMARAALACLKNDSSRHLTISQVLAVVRGDL
ncbi:kinase-like domain-containing protein [Tanacetum coccineum]